MIKISMAFQTWNNWLITQASKKKKKDQKTANQGFSHTANHSSKEIPAILKFNFKMLFESVFTTYGEGITNQEKRENGYRMLETVMLAKNYHLFPNYMI